MAKMKKPKNADKAVDVPESKDLDTQIKEASAELSQKPVKAEALVGTHNALATHLHIKGLFNSIYAGIVLGSIVASAAGIIFGKVTFTERLKLFPESLRALLELANDQLPRLGQTDPQLLGASGLLVLLIIVCWIKRKTWPLGYILTRLVLLLFWAAVAYWILTVLGLGETLPRWPRLA